MELLLLLLAKSRHAMLALRQLKAQKEIARLLWRLGLNVLQHVTLVIPHPANRPV